MSISKNRMAVPAPGLAPLVATIGGAAIVAGACLPWMSYFAGLIPLRGLSGINGWLMLGAGVMAVLTALALAKRGAARAHTIARRTVAILGAGVVAASIYLLQGVRELTRVHASNAMLAPKPGIGLLVILAGGFLLLLSAALALRADAGDSGRPLRFRFR